MKNNRTSIEKYFFWTLKLLLVLFASLSYFCMIKVLYCGCWACKTCIAIGILATLLTLYDRFKDFTS